MSINSLIKELKENNEDMEYYPTTDEMLEVIAPYLDYDTVLDIGCGTCNFKKYMDKIAQKELDEYLRVNNEKKLEAEKKGERYYFEERVNFRKIKTYYVMEKSKILLQKLDKDTICLGTDFDENTLIDKRVQVIFCNPPYSKYEDWTKKIISEGNFKRAFLVIPQRWKDNIEISKLIEHFDISTKILGSFDFLHAERQARAKVDVVMLQKRKYFDLYKSQEHFDEDAFNNFFNNQFGIKENTQEDRDNYKYKDIQRSAKNREISTALATCQDEGKSKAYVLVEHYQKDWTNLINNLNAVMKLDVGTMETFGLDIKKIKEALKMKLQGLKEYYWTKVMDEMEDITERLTKKFRGKFLEDFEELKTLDFTLGNIYTLILWVMKNASKYYDAQLIDFYKNLASYDNVKPYKSNQRLFEKDGWRWSNENKRDYVLDYRMILSSPFQVGWNGELESSYSRSNSVLGDVCVIARNLGFEVKSVRLPGSWEWGQKIYAFYKDDKTFMTYKVYKNGNMHVKFDIEFTKAMNVEVSRLLGWIRCKEDIEREFPAELAKGAEKYFKTNYTCLGTNSMPLLTVKKRPKIEFTGDSERKIMLIQSPYEKCLKDILSTLNHIGEETCHCVEDILEKCLKVLEEKDGFVYRNCLIKKGLNDRTQLEFKTTDDYNKFVELLESEN